LPKRTNLNTDGEYTMRLTDILSPECILVPLRATDKTDSIRQLVKTLAIHGKCQNESELLDTVLKREALRSTGIGQGLAVPHGKSDCCTRLVMALGLPRPPIDGLHDKDREPACIIVLLASPPSLSGPHIQALAKISRLMLNDPIREALLGAASAQQVYETLRNADF
jgi:mannitol/fructose-specific phosphotransferase system IIA component (Ntr-type)